MKYLFKITFDRDLVPSYYNLEFNYTVIATDLDNALEIIKKHKENLPYNLLQFVSNVTREPIAQGEVILS